VKWVIFGPLAVAVPAIIAAARAVIANVNLWGTNSLSRCWVSPPQCTFDARAREEM
jgi:hypothetical protein